MTNPTSDSTHRCAGPVRWVKSSYSGPTGGNCVEVASLGDGQVAIRDSWRPAGAALVIPAGQWSSFLAATRG